MPSKKNKGRKKEEKDPQVEENRTDSPERKEPSEEHGEDVAKEESKSEESPTSKVEEDAGEAKTKIEDLLDMFRRKTRVCEDSRREAHRPHVFWDTQPVPGMNEDQIATGDLAGPIDEIKTVAEVKQEPYNLPDAFEWHLCDCADEQEIDEIYHLLCENYVEDDDNMFRFDYSAAFLRWALMPPQYLRDWHLGVRVKSTKKLVAFISGIPAKMSVYDKNISLVEINFLCVHKKLRCKRMAPVLIKEITRRVNLKNVWQAVYTAGVVLPRPMAECRYYHRSLNPKKLIEVGFSHLQARMTMARTIKLYKLPDEPQIGGMRKMEDRDVAQATALLREYLKKFALHPDFNEEEVKHWVFPKQDVVYAYVREKKQEGNRSVLLLQTAQLSAGERQV